VAYVRCGSMLGGRAGNGGTDVLHALTSGGHSAAFFVWKNCHAWGLDAKVRAFHSALLRRAVAVGGIRAAVFHDKRGVALVPEYE
jgi:hypothetical protein